MHSKFLATPTNASTMPSKCTNCGQNTLVLIMDNQGWIQGSHGEADHPLQLSQRDCKVSFATALQYSSYSTYVCSHAEFRSSRWRLRYATGEQSKYRGYSAPRSLPSQIGVWVGTKLLMCLVVRTCEKERSTDQYATQNEGVARQNFSACFAHQHLLRLPPLP